MDPVRRIIIVVWSCGPDRPGGAQLAAAPFVYGLAARAAWTDAAHTKTVRDFIVEAHAAGIRLFACAMALHEHAPGALPSAESAGIAGAATVMALASQSDTRILTF